MLCTSCGRTKQLRTWVSPIFQVSLLTAPCGDASIEVLPPEMASGIGRRVTAWKWRRSSKRKKPRPWSKSERDHCQLQKVFGTRPCRPCRLRIPDGLHDAHARAFRLGVTEILEAWICLLKQLSPVIVVTFLGIEEDEHHQIHGSIHPSAHRDHAEGWGSQLDTAVSVRELGLTL